MTPTAAQLSAAYGINAAEAQNLLKTYTGKTTKSSGSSSGSSGSSSGSTTASNYNSVVQDLESLKNGGYNNRSVLFAVINKALSAGTITEAQKNTLSNTYLRY